MPPICSNASSLTMPDGLALAETGWIRTQPCLSAASKVAPKAERVPRNATGISLSRWKSRRRHSAMSVRCTLNVLVSCMNRPVKTRFTRCRSSPRRHRLVAAGVIKAAAGLAAEPAGLDVFDQQRAGPVLAVGQTLVEHLHDREAGVETDEIG